MSTHDLERMRAALAVHRDVSRLRGRGGMATVHAASDLKRRGTVAPTGPRGDGAAGLDEVEARGRSGPSGAPAERSEPVAAR